MQQYTARYPNASCTVGIKRANDPLSPAGIISTRDVVAPRATIMPGFRLLQLSIRPLSVLVLLTVARSGFVIIAVWGSSIIGTRSV